jgi:hypothetical protein
MNTYPWMCSRLPTYPPAWRVPRSVQAPDEATTRCSVAKVRFCALVRKKGSRASGFVMGGQAGPIGIHWKFGYSRTDWSNVDNFLAIGSPFRSDGPGLSDGERISYAVAFNFQPGPYLNLILKGEGDTSARYPSETREDHRVNALAGAIYGFQNGVAVHAAWQVDLHDPTPARSALICTTRGSANAGRRSSRATWCCGIRSTPSA